MAPGERAAEAEKDLALFHLRSIKSEFPGETPSQLSVRLASRMQPGYSYNRGGLVPFGPVFPRPIVGIRAWRDQLFVFTEGDNIYVLDQMGIARLLSTGAGVTPEDYWVARCHSCGVMCSARNSPAIRSCSALGRASNPSMSFFAKMGSRASRSSGVAIPMT